MGSVLSGGLGWNHFGRIERISFRPARRFEVGGVGELERHRASRPEGDDLGVGLSPAQDLRDLSEIHSLDVFQIQHLKLIG